jgi:murein DD-endopeptidase MepM/ murein hydrolase activator NlpD
VPAQGENGLKLRGSIAAYLAAVLVGVAVAPVSAAQDGAPTGDGGRPAGQQAEPTTTLADGGSGTTTVPPRPTTTKPPGPTTTVPGTPTAGPPGGDTTTTLPEGAGLLPPVSIPPELAADPRASILFDPSPSDGLEAPVFQAPFDPGSNQVLDGMVAELQAELLSKQRLLDEMQVRFQELGATVEALSEELEQLGEQAQAKLAEAAEAERALREHTVDAFVNGTSEISMVAARSDDPVELGIGRELLDSVVESDEALLARHEVAQARLDARQSNLLEEFGQVQAEYAELNRAFAETLEETVAEGLALKAYENGAQVYVKGFVFPVQGEVEFIDSWGFPRMTGTSQAHWHQGTDIFAPMGTPLVAVESGTIFKVGQAGLGGNRLWLRGDSGTEYYYAHVSAFAPGLRDGLRVNAGDPVAYVGDTGNAKGTPPHLHFQMHPDGGDPVNPYPLLKATYGTKPMVQVFEAPPLTVDPATGLPVLGAVPTAPVPGAADTTAAAATDPLAAGGAGGNPG